MQYLEKLGITGFPLIVFSVISLALILERSWVFYAMRPRKNHIHKLLQAHLPANAEAITTILEAEKSPLAVVAKAQIQSLGLGDSLNEQITRATGFAQLALLTARLRALSTIAHTAPLLGLLGTVLGLVSAFYQIETLGTVKPSDLAGGIWEALLTTVAGLVIAIPTLLAYHYFRSLAEKTAREMSETTVAIKRLNTETENEKHGV